MKKFLFLLLNYYVTITAQNISIYPYLQNATSNGITIMWECENCISSILEWGNSPNLGNTLYPNTEITSNSTLLHSARISQLYPNTKYYYKVKTENETTSLYTFITESNSSDEVDINIIAMSDMQLDSNFPNKFNLINNAIIDYFYQNYFNDLNQSLSMILIPGDLVSSGNNYYHWKNHFFSQSRELFSRVPFYPVLGNHEENSELYFKYMDLPKNGTLGYEEHWWYKDNSNVRIIGLNSNTQFRISKQLNWLDSILNMTIGDNSIDFVFAQLHHPHHSELWTPGNTNFTGQVISLLEKFTEISNKPSIHFYGHTHGYSRGESRDHEHLMINVATAGGAIDYWGDWPQKDYEEYSISEDEWGYILVEVKAGDSPKFVLKRLSLGDEYNSKYNQVIDSVEIRLVNNKPEKPICISPNSIDSINGNYAFDFNSSPFIDDFDEHGGSHWQVSSTCDDFDSPIIDKWVQHQNIYNNNITDNTKQLISQPLIGFQPNKSYCWRVRYRDKSLKWSEWSDPTVFFTDDNQIELKISPNPIVDESILSIPYYSSSKIKIFSIEGKLIKTYTKPNDSIIKLKNSDFKPGTYILKVFTDKMNVSQIKFIVI